MASTRTRRVKGSHGEQRNKIFCRDTFSQIIPVGARNCKNNARIQYMASTSDPSSVFEASVQVSMYSAIVNVYSYLQLLTQLEHTTQKQRGTRNQVLVQYMASTSDPSSVFESRERGASKQASANSETRYFANVLSQRSRSQRLNCKNKARG